MPARVSIRIQAGDFDNAAEIEALRGDSKEIGAVVTFTGYARADNDVTALTLEHYPGMTEREIARHVAEAEMRWPLFAVTIIHRIGRFTPSDPLVLVAVASARRGPAFEACQFLMDYLKARAPFWKSEERGGSEAWPEAKVSDLQAAERWH